MRRSLRSEALAPGMLDELLELARRAPSAGNTAATAFVVLQDDEVARYWDVTLPAERRGSFAWPELLAAPVLVVVTTDPLAYAARYAEDDKVATGLGVGPDAWPVPYWFVDAGCVVQNLLLLATDAGLGALLFGAFEHEPALRSALGVPDHIRLVGTVALGMPGEGASLGRSAQRPRPPLDEVVHRGGW